jgi:hypothetical protein
VIRGRSVFKVPSASFRVQIPSRHLRTISAEVPVLEAHVPDQIARSCNAPEYFRIREDSVHVRLALFLSLEGSTRIARTNPARPQGSRSMNAIVISNKDTVYLHWHFAAKISDYKEIWIPEGAPASAIWKLIDRDLNSVLRSRNAIRKSRLIPGAGVRRWEGTHRCAPEAAAGGTTTIAILCAGR